MRRKIMLNQEVKDIVLATAALTFAFGWRYNFSCEGLLYGMFISLVSVGTGSILHELAHRWFARKFGAEAHFKAWPIGLLIAIAFSIFSKGQMIFAAPGAVMISPRLYDRWYKLDHRIEMEENGIISLAGPATNLIIAAVGIALFSFTGFMIFSAIASVNAFLALFNSMPIGPLDGKKILAWDPKEWVLLIIISLVAVFLA